MKIYSIFKIDSIEIKIDNCELTIDLPEDFYKPTSDAETFNMFRDESVNNKLDKFISLNKSRLSIFNRLKYQFLVNRTVVMADSTIEAIVTIGQLFDYAELKMESRVTYILKKPKEFNLQTLEDLEKIKKYHLNGRFDSKTLISKSNNSI